MQHRTCVELSVVFSYFGFTFDIRCSFENKITVQITNSHTTILHAKTTETRLERARDSIAFVKDADPFCFPGPVVQESWQRGGSITTFLA